MVYLQYQRADWGQQQESSQQQHTKHNIYKDIKEGHTSTADSEAATSMEDGKSPWPKRPFEERAPRKHAIASLNKEKATEARTRAIVWL